MIHLDKVLYSVKAQARGGRTGTVKSDHPSLQLDLSTPKAMGGSGGEGTNPEQLFASGYAACFLGALNFVAGREKVTLSADTEIHATVGFGPIAAGGFGIQAELEGHMPGLDPKTAQRLLDLAHQMCPYSNATRNNIEVKISLAP